MKLQFALLALLTITCFFSAGCSYQQEKLIPKTNSVNPLAWIDTVRFNSNLNSKQWGQVYFARNNEEDYEKLTDTARIALRFSWYRSFHHYVVVRVENRPEIYDSNGTRKLNEEWFALYKEDISRLNHDCPVRKGERCFGKPFPHMHQQQVALLETNKMPLVVQKLEAIKFWQMQHKYMSGPHTDGSDWTLEVYYKGKYKAISVDVKNYPVKDLCLEMLKLTGYKIKKDEVY